MKTKLKIIIVLHCLIIGVSGAFAQNLHQSINAGGGNALGTAGAISYSVGQTFYSDASGSSGSISAGVQQPYEISVITAIGDAEFISLAFEVYPNPTQGRLLLKISGNRNETLSYQLYDLFGKLLQSEKIVDSETPVDMHSLAKATYLLRVLSENKEVKKFKIIKN